MSNPPTNINKAPYRTGKSTRPGEAAFRFLDLSGENLGVKVEALPPGGTSSFHHYHTTEEEHVVLLEGTAMLHLGDRVIALTNGDHLCFPAGEAVAHHIENTSDSECKYLVFGERKKDDVVFYPEHSTLLVKSSTGSRAYRYEEQEP